MDQTLDFLLRLAAIPLAIITIVVKWWLDGKSHKKQYAYRLEVSQRRLQVLHSYLELQQKLQTGISLQQTKDWVAQQTQTVQQNLPPEPALPPDKPPVVHRYSLLRRLTLWYPPVHFSGFVYRLLYYLYSVSLIAGLIALAVGQAGENIQDFWLGLASFALLSLLFWKSARRSDKRPHKPKL